LWALNFPDCPFVVLSSKFGWRPGVEEEDKAMENEWFEVYS